MELVVVLALVLILYLLLKNRKEGFVISFPNSDGWTYDHLYYSADRTSRDNHRGYQINNLQGVTPRDKL